MTNLKANKFLRPFRGKASESWKQFRDKFAVIAEILGWDSETKKMNNFPLFLDGDAFPRSWLCYLLCAGGVVKERIGEI